MTPDHQAKAARGLGLKRLIVLLPYTSLLGLVGLFVVVLLGFEEPHPVMLVVAAVLVLSAPLGMLVHLASTTELSPQEKRLWWRSLLGKNLWLLNSYFRPEARRAATARLHRSNEREGPKG